MHGNPELFRRQAQVAGKKLPGEAYRLALEIIPEAEIAEHFKKGVVARGVAHIFQVVVLAAGAHAALAAGRAHIGPRISAEEGVLELVHARVGEQQRRVVGGHQRATRHAGVPLLLEIGQKGLANLTRSHM